MSKGDGVEKAWNTPIMELKKRIKSFGELLEDGRVQDIETEQMDAFILATTEQYGELTSDEKKIVNKIKDTWKRPNPYVIL